MKGLFNRTVIVSLVLVLIGAGGLVVVSDRVNVAESVIGSIAATVLTIGLVALLYEWFMHRTITADLLDLVDLKRNLSDAGIQEVIEEANLGWRDVLTEGSEFELLLVDPTAWYEREWTLILAAGRMRTVSVQLYLPDPDGPAAEGIAASLALEGEEFRQTVRRVARQVEDGWKTARTGGDRLRRGSTLQISLFQGFPTHALLRADNEIVILLAASLGRQPGTQSAAMRFRRTNEGRFPAQWFEDQLRSLRSANYPAIYADKVR